MSFVKKTIGFYSFYCLFRFAIRTVSDPFIHLDFLKNGKEKHTETVRLSFCFLILFHFGVDSIRPQLHRIIGILLNLFYIVLNEEKKKTLAMVTIRAKSVWAQGKDININTSYHIFQLYWDCQLYAHTQRNEIERHCHSHCHCHENRNQYDITKRKRKKSKYEINILVQFVDTKVKND